MNTIITCRECGHQEAGSSEQTLMSKIKMLNHIEREHEELATTSSRTRMLTREERFNRETYNLEASY